MSPARRCGRPTGRPLPVVSLLLAVSCFVTGCGLPDPRPLLPPPTDPSFSDIDDTFSFSQPTAAGTDRVRSVATFGYEVYYRFSAVGASDDRNLEDLAQLRARQFVRLARASDRDPIDLNERPLIKVPTAARAAHRVTLRFAPRTSGEDPYATLSVGGQAPVSLRRGVANTTTGVYERFVCDRFEGAHADVAAFPELASACEEGQPVQLQLYAVAYGRDADRGEQFSEALYLGSIDIALP